jgi:hypothetical protein
MPTAGVKAVAGDLPDTSKKFCFGLHYFNWPRMFWPFILVGGGSRR